MVERGKLIELASRKPEAEYSLTAIEIGDDDEAIATIAAGVVIVTDRENKTGFVMTPTSARNLGVQLIEAAMYSRLDLLGALTRSDDDE